MAPLISSPATVSYGAQLNFETLTDEASLRFQPLQDTLLRVIDGVAELRFDGEEHLLGPGGEAIVPAGFHHTLCAVSGQARIVMGFRAGALSSDRVDEGVPALAQPLDRPAQPVAHAQVMRRRRRSPAAPPR